MKKSVNGFDLYDCQYVCAHTNSRIHSSNVLEIYIRYSYMIQRGL